MCKNGGSKQRAPVCVLLCRCSSSLRVNLFPQNIQLQTKGRSPECQRRCARRCDVFPYTFPQPAMWQMCCFFFPTLDPLRNTSIPFIFSWLAMQRWDYTSKQCTEWEDSWTKQPGHPTHLPPDSLQLGQVHATLRSRLPSWPNWSSSSTNLPWRWDRSLVLRVESLLSCQSESGSSLIWISEMNEQVNINTSSSKMCQEVWTVRGVLVTVCDWHAWQQISLHIKHSDKIISWLTEKSISDIFGN